MTGVVDPRKLADTVRQALPVIEVGHRLPPDPYAALDALVSLADQRTEWLHRADEQFRLIAEAAGADGTSPDEWGATHPKWDKALWSVKQLRTERDEAQRALENRGMLLSQAGRELERERAARETAERELAAATARLGEAERERDEARATADGMARAPYGEFEKMREERDALRRECQRTRDEWAEAENEARDRAEAAEAALRAAEEKRQQAERALRPFTEKWDLHAADYIALEGDSRELRVLEAEVVAEMLRDIAHARSVLAALPVAGSADHQEEP